jgi:hypothetical protein
MANRVSSRRDDIRRRAGRPSAGPDRKREQTAQADDPLRIEATLEDVRQRRNVLRDARGQQRHRAVVVAERLDLTPKERDEIVGDLLKPGGGCRGSSRNKPLERGHLSDP